MLCPGSNLRAVVARAIRLSSCHVVLRPLCLEGLVLYKTKILMLVDAKGPTYRALIVFLADQIRIRDTIFDHDDCVNATATNNGIHAVLTADSTAAVVLRPLSSHLDSQTAFQNLTFQNHGAAVACSFRRPRGSRLCNWTIHRLPEYAVKRKGCGSLDSWWLVV